LRNRIICDCSKGDCAALYHKSQQE
jgi:hypothetical protein